MFRNETKIAEPENVAEQISLHYFIFTSMTKVYVAVSWFPRGFALHFVAAGGVNRLFRVLLSIWIFIYSAFSCCFEEKFAVKSHI